VGLGEQLIVWQANDLTQEFCRGFRSLNLHQVRLFFLIQPIRQAVSG